MYKVLVVDDERLIREGIGEVFEGCKDFEVYYARSGSEALRVAESVQLDVILADIVMAGMDGITLLEQLADNENRILKVIISGYDKFEYAQAAVKNQVVEYLLKPCSPDKIEALMERLLGMLEERAARKSIYENALAQGKQYLELTKKMILKSNIAGKNLLTGLPRTQVDTLFPADMAYCVLMLSETKDVYPSTEILYANTVIIEKTLNELQEGNPHWFFLNDSSGLFTIVIAGEPEQTGENCIAFYERVVSILWESGICVCGGVGRVVKGLDELDSSYNEAIRALQYNKAHANEGILFIHEVEPIDHEGTIQFFHEQMKFSLHSSDEKAFLRIVDKICTQLREKAGTLPVAYVNYSFSQLVTTMVLSLAELSIGSFSAMNEECKACLNTIASTPVLEQKIEHFQNFSKKVIEIAEQKEKKAEKAIVKSIKKYVAENYQEEVVLDDISEQLQMNKYYISRVFKEDVGTNFAEYVNQYRVNIAKSLLKNSHMKIYEIALAVGYKSEYYFSVTFKRIVGVAPVEYRKNQL